MGITFFLGLGFDDQCHDRKFLCMMGVVRECGGTAVEDCSSGYHPAYFGGQLYGIGQRLAMIKQNVSSRNLRCCPPSLPLTNRINAITSMLPFVSPLLVSGALSCRHIALHTWTLLQPLPFCQRGTHAHARPSHLDRQHCSAGATMHQLDLSFLLIIIQFIHWQQ